MGSVRAGVTGDEEERWGCLVGEDWRGGQRRPGFLVSKGEEGKQKLREVAVWLEPAGEEEEEKIRWVWGLFGRVKEEKIQKIQKVGGLRRLPLVRDGF